MPFTGKATFTAGADLPEIVEDVSDLISIASPFETPLLDHLGDPNRAASATVHEWIEDELLPNSDTINQGSFTPNASDATAITMTNGARFRVGDQVRPFGAREVMFVTAVAGNVVTFVRRYGGSPTSALANGQRLVILANAALEGDDKPDTRFTNRVRRRNYTQIFTAAVEVSGSMHASRAYGAPNEIEFQKQSRVRELVRDLEAAVINGFAASANPQGSASVRRTMQGIVPFIATNNFVPNTGGFPAGGGAGQNELTEPLLNAALRLIWENAQSRIDTIVVAGAQKRRINQFLAATRQSTTAQTNFQDVVSTYETDFGKARVILARAVPPDTLLLLDSSRIDVLPLAGRSFHFKPLAATGDKEQGQLIGEYTLELRNELSHGLIRGLAAT
jgi:hypothetical protein